MIPCTQPPWTSARTSTAASLVFVPGDYLPSGQGWQPLSCCTAFGGLESCPFPADGYLPASSLGQLASPLAMLPGMSPDHWARTPRL